ncbi:MAG: hypothetical protein WB565_10075 [Acidimicrobiales bacterium]
MPEEKVEELLARIERLEGKEIRGEYVDAAGKRWPLDRHGLPPLAVTAAAVLPPRPLPQPGSWQHEKMLADERKREEAHLAREAKEARLTREREELEEWRIACWEANRPEREAARGELTVLEGEISVLRDKLSLLTDRRSALLEAANRFAPV